MGACCTIIPESKVGVVEYFGKYDRMLYPGFHFLNCCTDNISHIASLQLQIFDVNVETVTKDNVSINIKVAIQGKVNVDALRCDSEISEKSIKRKKDMNIELDEKTTLLSSTSIKNYQNYHNNVENNIISGEQAIYKSVYASRDTNGQISQLIKCFFRGLCIDYTMKELFVSKNVLSDKLTLFLNEEMYQYGFYIHKALIPDIDPPQEVKDAMNLCLKSQNLRETKINEANAEKTAAILKAEGNSEVRRLEGEGLAKQRKALVGCLKDSVASVCGKDMILNPTELTSTILNIFDYIKYIDAIIKQQYCCFIIMLQCNILI